MRGTVPFSVVITTYNRSRLVSRAIRSVIEQGYTSVEILVVDDGSTDETPKLLKESFPQVKYFRQQPNQGPGPARNRGIREATNPWVIILDDDDELLAGALFSVEATLMAYKFVDDVHAFPVLQFACSNGWIDEPFRLITLDDYLKERIKGDFVPVINRKRFLSLELAYPSLRIGGEHLLWWRIAKEYGIPTWSLAIVRVNADADLRLTSPHNQISRAIEYGQLQEMTLSQFGEELLSRSPNMYYRKILGAATYFLLAENRALARTYLKRAWSLKPGLKAIALWLLTFAPINLVRGIFVAYKNKGGIK
ncbi:glycosyltransferase family 2 protein [Thermus caldilimi]|uniref:glycosyltransferase family 2 protein n=1 Tax=Thermus caldilimi TaxID=2483360 RepID=UPI0010768B51|nr:glycosyltransferase family 2 protein [Thermus caldilimi]